MITTTDLPDFNELIFKFTTGTFPIIISAPHGGELEFPGVDARKKGVSEQDFHTLEIALLLKEELEAFSVHRSSNGGYHLETQVGVKPLHPFMAAAKVHRRYCDLNRAEDSSLEDDRMRPYYRAYHGTIEDSVRTLRTWGCTRVLLIDIHGQSAMPQHILRGTRNYQTVANLHRTFGQAAITGENSICGYLHKHGYPVFPSPDGPADAQEHPEYNGGWTVHHYSDLGVDAIQLEIGRDFRKSPEVRREFASVLAKAIVAYANTFIVPSLAAAKVSLPIA